MDISDIFGLELEKFLVSKKSTILVVGGSQRERHEVAGSLREQTFGHYFVYEFGDLGSFKRADPYIVNLDSLHQVSS
ncbi:MAG: hypothetical protein WC494_02610 [Candidatus Pacearchaeota archaeon]